MVSCSGFNLVLGSGGVKSIAGLGVMQVLSREGLVPASVSGCSAGAVFGALIAARMDMAQAVHLATTLWSRDITSVRRHKALLELALPRLAGFGDGFALRDDRLICQRLHAAFGNTCIEDLALPLRVQTTCATDGSSVVLERGRLDQALRASVALPFLFAPQRVGGRLLVDGSLSDPLPVPTFTSGPAHSGSALATVALGFRVPFPRSANTATRLATRVTAALSNNLLDSRLAAVDPRRLVLMLPVLDRRVGLFDTEAMPYLLEVGRQAAEAALPRLLRMLGTPLRCVASA